MIKRILKMTSGQILYSLAITLMIRANIGLSPWDVFHSGLAAVLGCTIGRAISIFSVILFFAALPLKWPIGLGTVANVILCGPFVDILTPLVPEMNGLFSGVVMFLAGIVTLAFASYMYIEPALGTSVRDSLFVYFLKITKLSTSVGRILLEVFLIVTGYLLGGRVGIGSVLSCVLTGPCMQFINRKMKFDLVGVHHESLPETGKKLLTVLKKDRSGS